MARVGISKRWSQSLTEEQKQAFRDRATARRRAAGVKPRTRYKSDAERKAARRAQNRINKKKCIARSPERKARILEYNREYNKAAVQSGQNRVWRLKTLFNLTVEDYDRMVAAQENHCAICPAIHEDVKGKRLAVDHDHKTGKIRGLLCRACNNALGLLNDDTERMRNAIGYLDRSIGNSEMTK